MNKFLKYALIAVVFLCLGLCLRLASASFFADTEKKESLSASVSESAEVFSSVDIKEDKPAIAPKDLQVEAALVIDLSSGSEIFSVDKEKRWPLASTSKIMSSIIALENMDQDSEVEISANAVATEGVAGLLLEKDKYTVSDLISAMMIVSSNDAAVALMESMPEGKFVSLMNEKAASLGMSNTYFTEPTGLSTLNQSSAEDMSRLLSYAWTSHPEIFKISSHTQIKIKEIVSGKSRVLKNINALSAKNNFLGGKTGFTEDARENLVAVIGFGKKPIGIIILGAENRAVEADKIIKFLEADNKK